MLRLCENIRYEQGENARRGVVSIVCLARHPYMGVPALLWAELTAEQVERLEAAATREEVRGVLAELCTSEAKHPQRREARLRNGCPSPPSGATGLALCRRSCWSSTSTCYTSRGSVALGPRRRASSLLSSSRRTKRWLSSKWMRPGPTGRLADRYHPPLGGPLSDSAADLGILQGAAARACGAAAAILGLPPSPLERIDHIPL